MSGKLITSKNSVTELLIIIIGEVNCRRDFSEFFKIKNRCSELSKIHFLLPGAFKK